MDVPGWLSGLGLGAHAEAFRANRIDGEVLLGLTAEDLRELGVHALGDRKRLLAAIEALRQAAAGNGREQPAVPAEAEYRQVTLLFADIAGFTALSERLGGEAVHALLNRFFDMADGLIARYGGTVDKHMGDSVMAVFGAPVAHDNDPERALRVAAELHEAARTIEAGDAPLRLHIGIASGQVIASGTGSAVHSAYTVTGSAVNIAARLQAMAEAGETLVTREVMRAVSGRFEGAFVGACRLKGVEQPVPVWRVTGIAEGADQSLLPFAGRVAELAQCRALIASVAAAGRGSTLVIRGAAGIGKSRMVGEVMTLARRESFAVHRAIVLDFGARKGQDAIAALVGSLLGLPDPAGRERGGQGGAAALANGAHEATDRAIVHDLLDLPATPETDRLAAALDETTRRAARRRVVAELFAGAARAAPCLVVVEDVHWADERTLDLVAAVAVAAEAAPLLLLCSTRPEGDPLEGAWRSQALSHPTTVIGLGPLRPEEAASVAAAFPGLDGGLRAACLDRASGNPLFLEQLLRTAAEAGAVDLPGSVRSLVLARLDRLPPEDRKALQAAAVLGQRFALAPLRALLGDPACDCAALVRHQLLRRDGEEFLFAHALIRDGVHDAIVGSRRRRLHHAAADWFRASDAVHHAEHLRLAEDPAAAAAFLAAARAERQRHRHDRAAGLLRIGQGLATGASERHALALELGDALHDSGAPALAIAAYAEALDAAPDPGARVGALLGLAAARRITDDRPGAFAALAEAEALAVPAGLVAAMARAHLIRGNLLFPTGDMDGCQREHGAALALARQAGSAELETAALGGLADADYLRGRYCTARTRFAECVAIGRAKGLDRVAIANLPMLALTALICCDVVEGNRRAGEAVAAAREAGNLRAEMIARHAAYLGRRLQGETVQARENAQRAVALARQLGSERFEAEGLIFCAEVDLATGAEGRALDEAREAVALTRRAGMEFLGPTILGGLCLATADARERDAAIAEAEVLLAGRTPGHNHFFFRMFAIEACLRSGLWEETVRHADALARAYAAGEAPLAEILARHGRALALSRTPGQHAAAPEAGGSSAGSRNILLDRVVAELRETARA